MYIKTLCVIIFTTLAWTTCKKLDVKNTFVYGPALNADIVLPTRYFYVHAVDTKGKNYTSSPGKDTFTFGISSSSSSRVRAWREVLDRSDGSFLVRFRLYDSHEDLYIEVKHNGQPVAKSPYRIKGMNYHEQCNCPHPDDDIWLKTMSCPQSYQQIVEDLKPFEKVDLDVIFKKGVKQFERNHAVCYYSVVNNEIYRKCYGEHVGFAMFMDAWLLSLARKVRLPDMEFFSNLGDWPLSKHGKEPIPVFSWCGSGDTYDVVMPTYDLTESTLESLGRVSLDMQSVQGNTGPKWKQKIEKGFFRGRDSRQERLDLAVLGRSKTDLLDIGLTNFFFFPYDEKKYGPKHKHVSFFDFFKYKYQINVDGTVAAYRFPYLLAGDSVVFKQDSPYYEHFYHDLQPMKHYIPFKRDLNDLLDQLKWAKANDVKAKNIASNGQKYARDNLLGDKLYCYSYVLFKEYARRLVQKPRVRDGMEHIPQPAGADAACKCRRDVKPKPKKKSPTKTPDNNAKQQQQQQQKSKPHEEL